MGEQLWPPAAGKFGRTRDGLKVGPLMPRRPSIIGCWTDGYRVWHDDGHYGGGQGWDIVAEWTDDPVSAHPIDFSKIRVGDIVRLGGEYRVVALNERASDGSEGPTIDASAANQPCVPWSLVKDHIPAGRSIEAGCKARTEHGDIVTVGTQPFQGVVLVEHPDMDGAVPWKVADLVRLDSEPA